MTSIFAQTSNPRRDPADFGSEVIFFFFVSSLTCRNIPPIFLLTVAPHIGTEHPFTWSGLVKN